ncbi:MAG: phage terminase large subunit family protein, partial [Methylococcales bacterium]|nr:phage terminase large subunit family protein [Methylococcales bacterium]
MTVNNYASAKLTRDQLAEILKPPNRMTVSEATRQYLILNNPGGYQGPWLPSHTPYWVEPMDTLTSRKHKAVIAVAPAQSGKTISLLLGWLTYNVTCDPSDMMLVETCQINARDFARRKINRAHRHSPELNKRISRRRNDDNVFDKHYLNGTILTMAWPTINHASGKSIRYVALTDYDRMSENIDGEGDPFSLFQKRTTAFLTRGMTLVESSPGHVLSDNNWVPKSEHEAPPTKGILGLYNLGDRRRYYWPCPHCGEYFEPGPGLGGCPKIGNITT